MDSDVKRRWIDALYSDDYTQGAGQLRNARNEFCCLGVLCDVIDPENWNDDNTYGAAPVGAPAAKVALPLRLSGQIGLDMETQWRLVAMNDSTEYRYTFRVLADWIKNNIEED